MLIISITWGTSNILHSYFFILIYSKKIFIYFHNFYPLSSRLYFWAISDTTHSLPCNVQPCIISTLWLNNTIYLRHYKVPVTCKSYQGRAYVCHKSSNLNSRIACAYLQGFLNICVKNMIEHTKLKLESRFSRHITNFKLVLKLN